MALKVKELIELLQQQDPEARVMVYAYEDFNGARAVLTKQETTDPEKGLYCKGQSFEEYNSSKYAPEKYIVISDESR